MAKHAAPYKPSLTFYTRRTIRGAVCLISDTHAGSPHALQPPVYKLFSGNEIRYNEFQRLLWHYYENDTCARMAEYRRHDVDTALVEAFTCHQMGRVGLEPNSWQVIDWARVGIGA